MILRIHSVILVALDLINGCIALFFTFSHVFILNFDKGIGEQSFSDF